MEFMHTKIFTTYVFKSILMMLFSSIYLFLSKFCFLLIFNTVYSILFNDIQRGILIRDLLLISNLTVFFEVNKLHLIYNIYRFSFLSKQLKSLIYCEQTYLIRRKLIWSMRGVEFHGKSLPRSLQGKIHLLYKSDRPFRPSIYLFVRCSWSLFARVCNHLLVRPFRI